MKKYPIVYIEWCDAIRNNDEWITVENILEWSESVEWTIRQVGFILKETQQYILLANKINEQKEVDRVDGVIKIPITWILKRVDLTKCVK